MYYIAIDTRNKTVFWGWASIPISVSIYIKIIYTSEYAHKVREMVTSYSLLTDYEETTDHYALSVVGLV